MSERPMPAFGRVFARCFIIQGSWNYETMMGTGFGWAAEPALRALDGEGGPRYRAALARQTAFFNAHPYFAPLAVGAAVRAELDGEEPAKIERLRQALCGPLGSVGDRLFWAGMLPACAAIGIALAALGAGGWAVVAFLGLYNAAHLACRWWALRAGWSRGAQVGAALGAPALRRATDAIPAVAAFCLGAMLPLQLGAQLRAAPPSYLLTGAIGAVAVGAVVRLLSPRLNATAVAALVLAAAWAAGALWR